MTKFKHISYSKGLAILLMDQKYQKIWSEWLYPCVILSLISQKCPWKQYRQPENGRNINDSSGLYILYERFLIKVLKIIKLWSTLDVLFWKNLGSSSPHSVCPNDSRTIGVWWKEANWLSWCSDCASIIVIDIDRIHPKVGRVTLATRW